MTQFVLTLIAQAGSILKPEALVSPGDVSAIERVEWLAEGVAADVFLRERLNDAAQHELRVRCHAARIDYVLQAAEGREKKLLISDMDSTLIEQECIDEMAAALGLKDKVAPITERAMRGELAFEPALRERVALLKDLSESELQKIYESRITLMPGAKTLVATMKARGASTHLVSGGFTFFTSRVKDALGFDTHDSNTLEIAAGKLLGTVAEPILGKEAKLERLRHYAAQHTLPLSATLAVGDGANDLPMLKASGLGVAYHAKPAVEAEAHASIRYNDLTALLYAQGIARDQWKTA